MLSDGTFPCTVISAAFGDNAKGIPAVQIKVQLDGGPNTGATTTYERPVDMKSAPFVYRSCKAVGWQGKTLVSLDDDSKKWIIETGGKTTCDIKHVEYDDRKTGQRKTFAACDAIGGRSVLVTPKPSSVSDADEAMRSAAGDDGLPF